MDFKSEFMSDFPEPIADQERWIYCEEKKAHQVWCADHMEWEDIHVMGGKPPCRSSSIYRRKVKDNDFRVYRDHYIDDIIKKIALPKDIIMFGKTS